MANNKNKPFFIQTQLPYGTSIPTPDDNFVALGMNSNKELYAKFPDGSSENVNKPTSDTARVYLFDFGNNDYSIATGSWHVLTKTFDYDNSIDAPKGLEFTKSTGIIKNVSGQIVSVSIDLILSMLIAPAGSQIGNTIGKQEITLKFNNGLSSDSTVETLYLSKGGTYSKSVKLKLNPDATFWFEIWVEYADEQAGIVEMQNFNSTLAVKNWQT